MKDRLPKSIDISQKYDLNLEDILSTRNSINLIHNTTNAVTKSYRKNYSNNLNWSENESIPFIIEEFDNYLSYCLNYYGIRKKIKEHGEIILNLKINASGTTQIDNIEAPFKIEDKEKLRLKEAIAALPIWTNEEEISGIELKINLN